MVLTDAATSARRARRMPLNITTHSVLGVMQIDTFMGKTGYANMTPFVANQLARQIMSEFSFDEGVAHQKFDELFMMLLCELGYEGVVKQFRELHRWYA